MKKIVEGICEVLVILIKFIVRSMLWCDRFILKRHFDIETPLYKAYWEQHSIAMQRKLDRAHGINVKVA